MDHSAESIRRVPRIKTRCGSCGKQVQGQHGLHQSLTKPTIKSDAVFLELFAIHAQQLSKQDLNLIFIVKIEFRGS